ncbi:MAG: PDZ domain-containing protein [Synergistaceae bacterium]
MKHIKVTAIMLAMLFILAPISQATAEAYCQRTYRRSEVRTRHRTVVAHGRHYYRPPAHRVYYPHPYYRDYYRSYDRYDNWAVAGGVGLLLGTIIASNNQEAQKRETAMVEYETAKDQAREACTNAVNTELQQFLRLVGETGVDNTLEFLKKYWGQKGTETFLDNRTNIAILTIFSPNDSIRVEYTIMKDYKEATVKASNLKYNVSFDKKAYFTEAKPEPATNKALGLQLDDMKRDKFGCLVVMGVSQNSPAYYAGISVGDSLIKVDGYDTRQLRSDQISSYIEKQSGTKSILKLVISTMGQKKTVEIRL